MSDPRIVAARAVLALDPPYYTSVALARMHESILALLAVIDEREAEWDGIPEALREPLVAYGRAIYDAYATAGSTDAAMSDSAERIRAALQYLVDAACAKTDAGHAP